LQGCKGRKLGTHNHKDPTSGSGVLPKGYYYLVNLGAPVIYSNLLVEDTQSSNLAFGDGPLCLIGPSRRKKYSHFGHQKNRGSVL